MAHWVVLTACGASLLAYLLLSDSVRDFVREASRLAQKL
jgi:hypothetical protein